MDFKSMQGEVDKWVQKKGFGYFPPDEIGLRLMEESGELAREINHRFGSKKKKQSEDMKKVSDEVGDIMFTLCCLVKSLGINLNFIFDTEDDVVKSMEHMKCLNHKHGGVKIGVQTGEVVEAIDYTFYFINRYSSEGVIVDDIGSVIKSEDTNRIKQSVRHMLVSLTYFADLYEIDIDDCFKLAMDKAYGRDIERYKEVGKLVVEPGIYMHHKGGRYEVLSGKAIHSENGSRLVVYKALSHIPELGAGAVFVHQVEDFVKKVKVGGEEVSRFRKVD